MRATITSARGIYTLYSRGVNKVDKKLTQLDMFEGMDKSQWGTPKPKLTFRRFYVVKKWSALRGSWMYVSEFGECGAIFTFCGKHGAYAFQRKAAADFIAKNEGGQVSYYDLCVGEVSNRYE